VDRTDHNPATGVAVDSGASRPLTVTPEAPVTTPVAGSGGGPPTLEATLDASSVTSETPAGSSRFKLGNRPPLTGIRALCMIPVVVYHSNFSTFPGAWVPLQVFFVLSGFLITAMLSSEGQRNDRISLSGFYSRRIVRLLPPLVFTVALLGIYAAFVHVADASQRLWGDGLAAMTYSDYRQSLGHAPFFGYLAQSWSLAVEEQFYIIWAVLMVAAVAMHKRRLAYGFAIAGVLLSIADRLYLTFSASHFNHEVFTRVYYSFDSRADALFIGCLLGLLATDGHLSNWRPWGMRLLTVGAIASSIFICWVLLYAPLWQESLVVAVRGPCPAGISGRALLRHLPDPLPCLLGNHSRPLRHRLVVLAHRAGPVGRHLQPGLRQLVPYREAPVAVATALRRSLTLVPFRARWAVDPESTAWMAGERTKEDHTWAWWLGRSSRVQEASGVAVRGYLPTRSPDISSMIGRQASGFSGDLPPRFFRFMDGKRGG